MHYSDFLPEREDGLFPPEATPGTPLDEYDFDRLLVLYNPVSPSVRTALRQIDDLQESTFGPKVDVRETKKGVEANQDMLAENLREGDILVLATGDGTTNIAVQALACDYLIKNSAIRRTPILPLGGGYANDLDVMLNDSRRRIAPSDIIEHGRIVPFRPLRAAIQDRDGVTNTRFAASYITFGASAYAADAINQPEHRGSRLQKIPGAKDLHKGMAILRALHDSVSVDLEQEGTDRKIYEMIFANGWLMAKGMVHFPTRLTDQDIYRSEVVERDFKALSRVAGQLALRRLTGERTTDDTTFRLRSGAYAQFDGEAQPYHVGTTFTVGPADTSLHAITTRVRP